MQMQPANRRLDRIITMKEKPKKKKLVFRIL